MTSNTRTKYWGVNARYNQQLQGRSEAMDRAAVFAWKRDHFGTGVEIAGYDKMAEMWAWCFEDDPSWAQIWRNVQEVEKALGLLDAVCDGLADVLDSLSELNEEPVPDYGVRWDAQQIAAGVN